MNKTYGEERILVSVLVTSESEYIKDPLSIISKGTRIVERRLIKINNSVLNRHTSNGENLNYGELVIVRRKLSSVLLTEKFWLRRVRTECINFIAKKALSTTYV